MPMIRCKADLHFYNSDVHDFCPYCRNMEGAVDSTERYTDAAADDDDAGTTVRDDSLINVKPKTVTRQAPEDATVGIFKKKAKFEPVTGWLVCTEGPARGKDFRIKPGINEIGRSDTENVEIVIPGDNLISRRDHAEIEYDHEENSFYLVRKKNAAVRLNGKAVRQPTELHSHDVIQFGESMFIFVPLCAEQFKWVIPKELSAGN